MEISTLAGVLAALGAFVAWGIGDFATQRAIRIVGTRETLLYICIFGVVVLVPFVWGRIPEIIADGRALTLLTSAGVIGFVSALINFEAFKRGKLAVVEPVMSAELVFTALIGVAILDERITFPQAVLMAIVFGGILLTMIHQQTVAWWQIWRHHPRFERGVIFAAVGAIAMAGYNVFTGLSSIATDPLMAIWYTHLVISLVLLGWFAAHKSLGDVFRAGVTHWRPLLFSASFDNVAWIAFATAVLALPISITIGITESYVVLAMVFGIFVNKERVRRYQIAGGSVAVVASIILAIISS